MDIYLDVVMVLNFVIDWFLLMAAGRLCGYPAGMGRSALGGLIGCLYGGACILPGFRFLGNFLWRVVFLLLMGAAAYGLGVSAFRRSLVFTFLSMALGGIALGVGRGGAAGLMASAALLFLLCALGFREKLGSVCYIPVELEWGDKRMKLTALQDTGNTLRDPVTGQQVLVVAPDVAHKITGLTAEQLQTPVETIGLIPGLRLIPYHTVGQPEGMMLAMKLPNVKIGSWQGSRVVAFSPNGLSTDGTYQALTGGNL